MLEGLERLVELQRVDDELTALEEENGAVPARRTRIAEARAASEQNLAGARAALESAEAGQRQAEATLQEQESLLQRLEGQQFQVKSNEAYTALLHEMDQARQAISDCETRILEAMEAIESARAALRSAEEGARSSAVQLAAEEKALDAREQELAREIATVRERRGALCAQIEAELLARYAKIASSRRPAVVLVSEEMCLGCRVDIPPQSYIEIRRGERVITCGNCHRILIHEEKLSASAAS